MSDFTAESLEETLSKADKVFRSYGPLGGSLAILELRPTFEAMKSTAEDLFRSLSAARQELRAVLEYKTAVERFITGLEERRRQLEEHTTPEERRLQGRLSDLEQRLSLLDERRRQAENIAQMGIEEAARWVRSVRGGA